MMPRRKPRSSAYVVYGEPLSLSRQFGSKGWNGQKQYKMKWEIDLDRQHNHRPLFTGPLFVDITFYFPIPPRARTIYTISGAPFPYKPDLYGYINFFHEATQGIIYENDAVIISLNARKLYDDVTRTEFIITEIIR
jgi:Holliday junction resolvase RusA-like endonuclease